MNAASAGHTGSALDSAGRQLDQIRLVGISAVGHHGVFEHERREGQVFRADVVAHLDTRRAAATDDLAHTLHYGVLAEQIAGVLSGEPADLIETVAERIAATVLAHTQVVAVDVAVHKPQAPLTVPFDDVVVSIRRDRSKLPAAEPWAPAPITTGSTARVSTARVSTAPTPTAVLPVVEAASERVAAAPVVVAAQALGTVPFAEAPTSASTPEPTREPNPEPMPVPTPEPAPEPATHVSVADVLDELPAAPTEVVLALGSNLGTPQETLRQAVAALAEVPGLEVVKVSPLARSAPVGGPEQPDFLNAVVIARTTLAPRALLRATQAIEAAHDRRRDEHWGPRTLDIDLIVYGSILAVTDDLELPHPRAHERAFVLQPWAQIAPDAVLPGLGGGPVAALAATAPDLSGIRWLALDWLVPPADHPAPEAHEPEPPAESRPEPSAPVWVPRTPPTSNGGSPTSWIP